MESNNNRPDLTAKKKWRDKNKDNLSNIQVNKTDKVLIEKISAHLGVTQKQTVTTVLDFFIKTKKLFEI